MKILHVIPSFDPSSGGPPRIALRLAAGAASLGHEVHMLAHDYPAAVAAIEQERAEVPGASLVHQHVLPPLTWSENWLAIGSRREVDRIIGDFDVVHTHSIWNGISRATMKLARRRGVAYAVLVNGMLDPWSLAQGRWKKKLAMMLGMRQLLNDAAFLQAGSLDEKNSLIDLGLRSPIEIIPNGIYPQEFGALPAAGEFAAGHPELAGRPYILFLSRLHYQKGLDFLTAAFALVAKRNSEVQLVVAGPDGGARKELEADVADAGLENRVHIVGPMFGRDRFAALRDAACFCLPSRQEGFSMAVLEAMACATPVVISTGCHFPQVADAGAGRIVSLDATAIADALLQIVADPASGRRMGQAGRNLVYQQFTWPIIAQKTIAAYQRATSRA